MQLFLVETLLVSTACLEGSMSCCVVVQRRKKYSILILNACQVVRLSSLIALDGGELELINKLTSVWMRWLGMSLKSLSSEIIARQMLLDGLG